MALQEKLDAMREMAKTRIPPEARAVMELLNPVPVTGCTVLNGSLLAE